MPLPVFVISLPSTCTSLAVTLTPTMSGFPVLVPWIRQRFTRVLAPLQMKPPVDLQHETRLSAPLSVTALVNTAPFRLRLQIWIRALLTSRSPA
jgi:hypothetical protein